MLALPFVAQDHSTIWQWKWIIPMTGSLVNWKKSGYTVFEQFIINIINVRLFNVLFEMGNFKMLHVWVIYNICIVANPPSFWPISVLDIAMPPSGDTKIILIHKFPQQNFPRRKVWARNRESTNFYFLLKIIS